MDELKYSNQLLVLYLFLFHLSFISFFLILCFKSRIFYDSIWSPLMNYYLCFCITFFNGYSRAGVDKPMVWASQMFLYIKFYWNRTMPICFCTQAAFTLQWKSWVVEREVIKQESLKYILYCPLRKCFLTPALGLQYSVYIFN